MLICAQNAEITTVHMNRVERASKEKKKRERKINCRTVQAI